MKEKLEKIILQEGVRQGLFTVADLSVTRQSSIKDHFNFGLDGVSDSYQPRVFDIASKTKMIVTLLVYRLLTLKVHPEFSLDAPVINFIPDMSGPFVDELTIRHLLTFHAEFNRFVTPGEMMRECILSPGSRVLPNMLDQIKKVGLEYRPGLKHNYANVHTILLGIVLESLIERKEKSEEKDKDKDKKSTMKLEELIHEYITRPLGLVDTLTNPISRAHRCVIAAHGLKLGQVSDSVARLALGQHQRLLGSAGLFSTSKDMLDILDIIMLGEKHPTCPISAKFVDQFHIPLRPTSNFGQGFGLWSAFRQNLEQFNPTLPPGGIFKSGYSGCIAMCSREFGVAFTFMTNFLHKHRSVDEMRRDRGLLHQICALVAECVFTS